MSLSDPRIIYGVHNVAPYNRLTGLPYGMFRVLEGSSVSLQAELVKLNGGSNPYPWAVEQGNITSELSIKPDEYPDFLFELFLGKAPTASGVDSTGTITTPLDINGTTVMDASTGLASVTVIPTTGAANLKFSRYVLKATTDDDLNIYALTNVDFARGTDTDYTDDLLLVATVAVGDAGATTDVAALGLRFTAGSGTTAFTVGDTAGFQVKPPSTKSMTVRIGGSADFFPEFGAILIAQKRSNLEMFEVDAFRCKGAGAPIGLETKAFGKGEIKAEIFYDSAKNGIADITHISPTS